MMPSGQTGARPGPGTRATSRTPSCLIARCAHSRPRANSSRRLATAPETAASSSEDSGAGGWPWLTPPTRSPREGMTASEEPVRHVVHQLLPVVLQIEMVSGKLPVRERSRAHAFPRRNEIMWGSRIGLCAVCGHGAIKGAVANCGGRLSRCEIGTDGGQQQLHELRMGHYAVRSATQRSQLIDEVVVVQAVPHARCRRAGWNGSRHEQMSKGEVASVHLDGDRRRCDCACRMAEEAERDGAVAH